MYSQEIRKSTRHTRYTIFIKHTTASLTISGGTPPYTETWSSAPNRVYAGTMTYTITDSSGCQLTNSFTVSLSVLVSVPIPESSSN